MDYLTKLFVQEWHMNNPSPPQQQNTSTLDLVNFLEDRIRAIQVDLVVSQSANKELQYRLVKLHIVIMYLMLDEPKYERQHGLSALQTALASYWNDDIGLNKDMDSQSMDDEILAFTALVQLNEDLRDLETDRICSFGASIMSTYRKQIKHDESSQISLPLFQWSLRLVVSCNLGEWFTVLHQLYKCDTSFGILASCCLAPSLGRIRAKCLQAYNIAFMKGERITESEIARLLIMPDGAMAGRLCAKLNLPVNQENGQEVFVTFKVAPLEMNLSCPKNTRDDWFVFRCENDWNADILHALLR
jgi:hypothetical protein